MMDKVVMVLADGFEECEAIIPADVLRRLEVDILLAGLDSYKVRGSHDIFVEADCRVHSLDFSEVAAVILPGGMPGAANLRESQLVMDLIHAVNDNKGIVAAICAAPIALYRAGVINGKKITCYPGFEETLRDVNYTGKMTEVDGNIITGKGPGAAFEFSVRLAEALGKKNEVKELYGVMFVD